MVMAPLPCSTIPMPGQPPPFGEVCRRLLHDRCLLLEIGGMPVSVWDWRRVDLESISPPVAILSPEHSSPKPTAIQTTG
jgi:hypothetical protein